MYALLAAGVLTAPRGVWAQPPEQAGAAQPPLTAALAGAHEALRGLAEAKTLPEAADHLTNRSAGALGFLFAIPMTIVISIATMDHDPSKPAPDPTLQKDFTDFTTRYFGDPESSQNTTDFPDTFKGHERDFIRDLIGFNTRLGKLSKTANVLKFDRPLFMGVSQYKFTLLSPSEVRITPITANAIKLPGVTTLTAMQENGQWRIDLGDPAAVVRASENASKAPPAEKRDPMDDQMIAAVKAHDQAQMKDLLHANPKLIEAKDQMGQSALYNAVFYDDIPTATFLIAHGAKVNAPNEFGETVLNEAVFFEKTDMVAFLKKHGAKFGVKTKNAF